MTVRQPLYSKEEFARRGKTLYETKVRSQVELDHQGQIVAIDVDTGSFEIGKDSLSAAKKLLERCPNAQIYGVRVGHPAVHRFGFRSSNASI